MILVDRRDPVARISAAPRAISRMVYLNSGVTTAFVQCGMGLTAEELLRRLLEVDGSFVEHGAVQHHSRKFHTARDRDEE